MGEPHKAPEGYDNLRGLIWGFWAVLSASAMNISVRGASVELNAQSLVLDTMNPCCVLLSVLGLHLTNSNISPVLVIGQSIEHDDF